MFRLRHRCSLEYSDFADPCGPGLVLNWWRCRESNPGPQRDLTGVYVCSDAYRSWVGATQPTPTALLLFRLTTNNEQQFVIIGYLLITVLAASRRHSSTGVRPLGPTA